MPPVLYGLGNLGLLDSQSVCVVGTRQPSAMGILTTRDVVNALVRIAGVTVMSGLARGIDIEAQRETLRCQGKTIAVIGSGLDRIYPKNHKSFVEKMVKIDNLILSPFPPHAPPLPYHFPRRNLVMARLACGTVCIEGSLKSGSLITGKASIDLGKTTCVYTQDYRSDFGKGAIELIRMGAEPVTDSKDMLEKIAFPQDGQLGLFPANKSPRQEFSLEQFAQEEKISIREAMVKIETLILKGRIEKRNLNQYNYVAD